MDNPVLKELLSPDYISKRILSVQRFILSRIAESRAKAFKRYYVETSSGFKPLAAVDLLAEQLFMNEVEYHIHHVFHESVRIEGEESLDEDTSFEKEDCISILIDMIDGTDLLERGFSNWCSAIVIFDPKDEQEKIKGSFVAIRSEKESFLYYATYDREGAYKKRISDSPKNEREEKLEINAAKKPLSDASVCLYGQKSNSLLSLLSLNQKIKFTDWLTKNAARDKRLRKQRKGEVTFRFYNLAGNPMMVRLAEGVVDVVFDLKGQSPHDVVPGAFIAVKAGATLGGTEKSEEISLGHLGNQLLYPGRNKIRYILAANQKMRRQMFDLVS